MSLRKNSGITLIEVLVVVALLGLLATAVVVTSNPQKRRDQSRDVIRKSSLATIANALNAYLVDKGSLPSASAGSDGVSNSLESDWLSELVPNYLKTIPKDPKKAFNINRNKPQIAGVTVPDKSKTYQMKVLVINYMPTVDNVNLNSNITGITTTLAGMRSWVNTIKNETLQALEDGSKYHDYYSNTVQPALDYSIYQEYEYLQTLPLGLPIGGGLYRPDYRTILTNHNICNLVENQGVREVWLFGWHHGSIVPVESNMSGPYGDVSNSERTDDMPKCAKTYVLYNYNYGRSSNEATHNHGHHMESLMAHVDQQTFDTFTGPWQSYSNDDGSVTAHRCGWTHSPPNAGNPQYIYNSSFNVWTDCEDWKLDGSGTKVRLNCNRWSCNERRFHIWRWNSIPGRNNPLAGYTNWWDFKGDFDSAMATGQKLVYDVTAPTVPQNLNVSSVNGNRVNLVWGVSTDDFGVAGYNIKRNGTYIGTSASTTFTDFSASANTTYQYTVSAVDTSQNTSQDSAPVSATTGNASDITVNRPQLDTTVSKNGYGKTTYSWMHAVGSQPSRYLTVGVSMRKPGNVEVTGVTYKGASLTRIGFNNNGGVRTELWGLRNPDPGVNEIVVNLSGIPNGSVAGSSSWWAVDQLNPLRTFVGSGASSTSPSVTLTTQSTDRVVDVLQIINVGQTITAGSGQTVYTNILTWGDSKGALSYKDGASGTTTMSWSTNYEAWSISAVPLRFDAYLNAVPTPTPQSIPTPPPPIPTPAATQTPANVPSPEPVVPVGCPDQDNVFCYFVSENGKEFVLWARLENMDDEELWYKSAARCRLTPPNAAYFNYCVKNY